MNYCRSNRSFCIHSSKLAFLESRSALTLSKTPWVSSDEILGSIPSDVLTSLLRIASLLPRSKALLLDTELTISNLGTIDNIAKGKVDCFLDDFGAGLIPRKASFSSALCRNCVLLDLLDSGATLGVYIVC